MAGKENLVTDVLEKAVGEAECRMSFVRSAANSVLKHHWKNIVFPPCLIFTHHLVPLWNIYRRIGISLPTLLIGDPPQFAKAPNPFSSQEQHSAALCMRFRDILRIFFLRSLMESQVRPKLTLGRFAVVGIVDKAAMQNETPIGLHAGIWNTGEGVPVIEVS